MALLLNDPALAMRVGIYFRAVLMAGGVADTRIAIGLGTRQDAPFRSVSLSTGQAFVLSGRALDEMTLYSNLTIRIPESSGPLSDWMPVIGHLCDSLVGQWTRRQAEIVCVAVHPREPDYEKIGQSLHPPVSRQAVAKGLNGANWHVIREAIHQFEETSWTASAESTSALPQPKMVALAQTTKKG
ncbi:MAG: hypothetical protein WDO73_14710 [Ignavibacteriota bacterium]